MEFSDAEFGAVQDKDLIQFWIRDSGYRLIAMFSVIHRWNDAEFAAVQDKGLIQFWIRDSGYELIAMFFVIHRWSSAMPSLGQFWIRT